MAKSKRADADKPRLTDAERYARFLEAAKKAEASDDPEDFERAFKAVTSTSPKKPPTSKNPKGDD